MNDTVITAAFKRRELKIWAVCFVAAILVNAGAILWFETHCRRSAVGRVGREEVGLPQVQVG